LDFLHRVPREFSRGLFTTDAMELLLGLGSERVHRDGSYEAAVRRPFNEQSGIRHMAIRGALPPPATDQQAPFPIIDGMAAAPE